MTSLRKTAFVAGLLYPIASLAIPPVVLYGPALDDPNFKIEIDDPTDSEWALDLRRSLARAH